MDKHNNRPPFVASRLYIGSIELLRFSARPLAASMELAGIEPALPSLPPAGLCNGLTDQPHKAGPLVWVIPSQLLGSGGLEASGPGNNGACEYMGGVNSQCSARGRRC